MNCELCGEHAPLHTRWLETMSAGSCNLQKTRSEEGRPLEFIVMFIALFLFFHFRSMKRERKRLLRDIRDQVGDRLIELAPEQAAYENQINSLPALAGDGKFSVAVDLRVGDRETFDNYFVYLEAIGNQNEPAATILTAVRQPHETGRVEVSLGHAYMGKVMGEVVNELFWFIEEHGGRMACAGVLLKQNQRLFRLDISNPPRLDI